MQRANQNCPTSADSGITLTNSQNPLDRIASSENVARVTFQAEPRSEPLDVGSRDAAETEKKRLVSGLQCVAGVQATDVKCAGSRRAQPSMEFDLQAKERFQPLVFQRCHGGASGAGGA